jgi:hypothetical protein
MIRQTPVYTWLTFLNESILHPNGDGKKQAMKNTHNLLSVLELVILGGRDLVCNDEQSEFKLKKQKFLQIAENTYRRYAMLPLSLVVTLHHVPGVLLALQNFQHFKLTSPSTATSILGNGKTSNNSSSQVLPLYLPSWEMAKLPTFQPYKSFHCIFHLGNWQNSQYFTKVTSPSNVTSFHCNFHLGK